jgi:hypothetical protein
LIDGAFHTLSVHLDVGSTSASISIDGILIATINGFASSFSGIGWGDDAGNVGGTTEIDSVSWTQTGPAQVLSTILPSSLTAGLDTVTIDGSTTSLQYSASVPQNVGATLNPTNADIEMQKVVQQVTKQMKKQGWKPPLPAPGRYPDPGAFGKEVDRRASQILGNRKNWATQVYVDDATKRIVSIGAPPPGGGQALKNTTQIDAAALKGGYRPVVGQIWDATKADVYEIKASAYGGYIADWQLSRLRALGSDGHVRLVRPLDVYKQGAWTVNARIKTVVRVLQLIGLATAAWNVINYAEYDGEFNKLMSDIQTAAARKDPDQRLADGLLVLQDAKQYLSHFTPGDSDIVVSFTQLGAITKLINDYPYR